MYGHDGIIPPFRIDMMLMLMLMPEVLGEHETTCRYLFLYCAEIPPSTWYGPCKDRIRINRRDNSLTVMQTSADKPPCLR